MKLTWYFCFDFFFLFFLLVFDYRTSGDLGPRLVLEFSRVHFYTSTHTNFVVLSIFNVQCEYNFKFTWFVLDVEWHFFFFLFISWSERFAFVTVGMNACLHVAIFHFEGKLYFFPRGKKWFFCPTCHRKCQIFQKLILCEKFLTLTPNIWQLKWY